MFGFLGFTYPENMVFFVNQWNLISPRLAAVHRGVDMLPLCKEKCEHKLMLKPSLGTKQ